MVELSDMEHPYVEPVRVFIYAVEDSSFCSELADLVRTGFEVETLVDSFSRKNAGYKPLISYVEGKMLPVEKEAFPHIIAVHLDSNNSPKYCLESVRKIQEIKKDTNGVVYCFGDLMDISKVLARDLQRFGVSGYIQSPGGLDPHTVAYGLNDVVGEVDQDLGGHEIRLSYMKMQRINAINPLGILRN
jgi:hypothetical protein